MRTAPSVRRREVLPAAASPLAVATDFRDPYVDYGRFLTPEGGILIVFKDIDTRLHHTLWRVFAWSAATGGEAWFLLHHSPLQDDWHNAAALLVLAILNFFIVQKPVELYRRVELRPDCLIIDGNDIFWRRHMENGPPAFQPDDDGNSILCGIYGTRWVEYLTLHRFDDLDRMPEVLMAHLQDAMTQLWERADEFR